MSASQTQSVRKDRRAEDDERRSRKGATSLTDSRPSATYSSRQHTSQFELKSSSKSAHSGINSHQTKHHRREKSKERHRSSKLRSSVSPHQHSRAQNNYTRSRDFEEDRTPHRHKYRYDVSASPKRRRSRSVSPVRAHSRTHRRIGSRSPSRADNPYSSKHTGHRGRRLSPDRSLDQTQRPEKRRRRDIIDTRDSDSSPRRYRARSPISRTERSDYRRHRRSSPAPRPRSRSPELSARPDTYSRRRRASHHSPLGKDFRDKDSRRQADSFLVHPTRDNRSANKSHRRRESPATSRLPAGSSAQPSQRQSPQPSRTVRESIKPRARSPTHHSKHASSKEVRHDPDPASDPATPSPKHENPDMNMSDPYMRPTRSISGDYGLAPRRREIPANSSLRPIPSFAEVDDRGYIDDGVHYQAHGMKSSHLYESSRPSARPQIDTRQSYSPSPHYMTPNSAHHPSPHHVSPQSASPYSNGRGWGQQHSPYHGHTPQVIRKSSYSVSRMLIRL